MPTYIEKITDSDLTPFIEFNKVIERQLYTYLQTETYGVRLDRLGNSEKGYSHDTKDNHFTRSDTLLTIKVGFAYSP